MEIDSRVSALCRPDVDVPFKKVIIEWLGGNRIENIALQLNEVTLQPSKGSLLIH
jgi:hypothetical protein